jgi:hypothetical protein
MNSDVNRRDVFHAKREKRLECGDGVFWNGAFISY